MTTRTELLEIIANGENSGVEFKRDDLRTQDLAKDLGGTASKAEKKICQSKIVSYIQKHNKTVVPKMITT